MPLDQSLVREALPLAALRLTKYKRTTPDRPLGRYYDDPKAFVHECFLWRQGESLTDYQDDILDELAERKRVSVRGPHSLGKTAIAAMVLLWFSLTRDDAGDDWKIPTTASAWRQLTHFLWPEVHKWARRLRWNDRLMRNPFNERIELQKLSLSLRYGEAFALASDNASLIEGAHAKSLLYIFDESKAINPETFDAAEGALASGDAYALMVSTPGEPNGRFYDVQARKAGYEDWKTIHVTKQQVIDAGRMSKDWAEQRVRQWGVNSAVYQNRVEGEFASSDEDSVIPLSWIELANERWHSWMDAQSIALEEEKTPFTCVGVDVAAGGEDQTVLALRYGDAITELRRYSREDTMATTGRVVSVLDAHGGKAIVDGIGVGAGVVHRLKELDKNVVAFIASEGSDKKDVSGELGYANKRSEAWWTLRELLDPANRKGIALPPDDLLTGDLTAPKWRVLSGGKILIESKDDIRKRIGRSTDTGDAVVQAFWADSTEIPAWWLTPGQPRQRSEMESFERILGQ